MTLSSPSVMLVDDEHDIVSIFSIALQAIGLKVHSFTQPTSAFSFFESNSQEISLIISDIRMPGLSGFELATQAKAIKPEVKILLMTAHDLGSADYTYERSSLGVDEFVQKPILPSKLNSIIMKHLQTAEQTQ